MQAMKFTDTEKAEELAQWLEDKSADICADNECTDEEHNCDSVAYGTVYLSKDESEIIDCEIHDICASDYWRGYYECERTDETQHRYEFVIYLPFAGNSIDLAAEIETGINW